MLYIDYTQLTHPLLPNMSMHRSTHQLDYTSTIPNSLIHSSRTCSCFHPHINYAIHRLYPTHSSTPLEHVPVSIHTSIMLYIDYTQLTHPLLSNMFLFPSTHQLCYIHRLYPTDSSTPPEHVHAQIHTSTILYIDYTQLTHPLLSNMFLFPSTHQLCYT